MTESDWRKSKDGGVLLTVVADRLTPRKWALLACSVVRRVLHLLPAKPFHEAVDFAEQNQVTEANIAVSMWHQRLDDAVLAALDAARDRQGVTVRDCNPDADPGLPRNEDGDNEGEPAAVVFGASSRYAAGSMAAAATSAESAAHAVRHLFGSVGAARLEVVRQSVNEAQVASAEATVLAFIAFDLLRKAERLAETSASSTRRRNLQFSIAANIVDEIEGEADRKYEQASQEKRTAETAALAHLIREQLGNPFQPYTFPPAWRTETVVALASGIEAERAFDRMPILADALEEARCDERPILDHLRGLGPHARGCLVLDLILSREPELFALPPIVPAPRRMQLGPHTPPPEGMA